MNGTLAFGLGVLPGASLHRRGQGHSRPHASVKCTAAGEVSAPRVSGTARKAAAWLDAQLTAGLASRPTLEGDIAAWQTKARNILVDGAPPTRRDEDWRFTDLRALYEAPVAAVSDSLEQAKLSELAEEVLGPFDGDKVSARAIILNGIVQMVSIADDADGLALASWNDSSAMAKTRAVEALSEAHETGIESGDTFHRLNAAVMADVLVLDLPKNASYRPIQILFVASGGSSSSSEVVCGHPRFVVLAGENASASIVEQHVSHDKSSVSFVNSCSTIKLGTGSQIDHAVLSMLSDSSFHIAGHHASVTKDAKYTASQISSTGRTTRSTVGIDLIESGASCALFGLGIADQQRTADLHSRIVHAKPNCTSEQLHKQVAAERGHAVFRGRIVVEEGAAQTNSTQLCRSLLLSSTAEVDAMPNLEIHCDDVKCTHGATIADLEVDELFYIQSRGIDPQQARFLMIGGFVDEMLARVPLLSGKEFIRDRVKNLASAIEGKKASDSTYSSV